MGSPLSAVTGIRPFGAAVSGERVGQSLLMPTAELATFTVLLQKIGTPLDGVRARIESDYGGLPAYCLRGHPLFEDAFTGANGTGIRAHDSRWYVPVGAFTLNGNGQVVTASAIPLSSNNYAVVDTPTPNQIIEGRIVIPAALGIGEEWSFGIIGRMSGTSYYELRILWQNNSAEIELFAIVGGSAVQADGDVHPADNILIHNAMLKDTFLPGTEWLVRLVLDGTSISGYLGDATAPLYDGAVTPSTYVGASAPNGWVTATASANLHALITGTRAGIIQSSGADKPGIWSNFAVYAADAPNVTDTVAATALTSGLSEVTFTLPSFPRTAGERYHLIFERTGANDPANYYAIGVDGEAGYAGGNAEIYNSTRTLVSSTAPNSISLAAPFWAALLNEDLCIALTPPVALTPAITAATAATAALRAMVAATDDPALTDAEIAVLLAASSVLDRYGVVPTAAGWTPTYNLNIGARDGWKLKTAKVAGRFDFGSDVHRFSRSQFFDHCEKMVKLYARAVAGGVTLESTGLDSGWDSVIGNINNG